MSSTESDSDHCFHCTDENSNPRLLQCFHSFCPECLEALDQRSSSGVVDCPDCSEHTVLNEDLDQLPQSSIFGKRILEINKILRQSTDQESCAGCQGNDGSAPYNHVISYCLDCQEFFCDACAENHTHFRFAASHRLITGNAEEVRKPRDLVQGLSTFCKVHVEETEKLYCRQCDECVCEMCYAKNHDRCEQVVPVDEMRLEMEEFVKKTIDGLRTRIDLGTEFLQRLEREERQLIRRANRIEGELENQSCVAKEFVTRSAKDFHDQLENQARQTSEIYDITTRVANQQVEDLEIFRTTMTRCLEKASLAHLVSINSGGRLQKVEREAKDFSECWHTMLLAFDESKELEELLGDDSIGEVLGRFEETDSDDGYLDNGNNSGPEFCDEYDVNIDHANEKIEINKTAEVDGDVQVDNGQVKVRIDDKKTTDKENIEDRENKEEIADTEAALRNDYVEIVVDKTENREQKEEEREILYKRTTKTKNENREMTAEDLESLLAMELNRVIVGTDSGTKPPKTLHEKKGKKIRTNYEGSTKLFTVPSDEADEEYEFTMAQYDSPHQTIDHRNTDNNEASAEMVIPGSYPTNENTTWSKDSVPELSFSVRDNGPWVPVTTFDGHRAPLSSNRNTGAVGGLKDCRSTFHQSVSSHTASEPGMSFLWNRIDQGRRGEEPSSAMLITSFVNTTTPPDGMSQSRAEQAITGSSRFSASHPPIAMRQNGSEQDSNMTPFPVTSGYPIAARENASQSDFPDTNNYSITMRKNGAERNLTRTRFPDTRSYPFGSIQNWSRPEAVEPEVLFCHEADTYRGNQRVGSGLIKVLIGKEDNTKTFEMYLEWDEEFEHLTPDSHLEILTLDPETYTIQVSSPAQLGREASRVKFENGEEAEKFENTLEQLIGQMDSLRITNKATPC